MVIVIFSRPDAVFTSRRKLGIFVRKNKFKKKNKKPYRKFSNTDDKIEKVRRRYVRKSLSPGIISVKNDLQSGRFKNIIREQGQG